MKTIRIYAGISGVIPNGSYQNLKPSLLIEETITDCVMTDAAVEARQKELYKKCYVQFTEIETQAVIDRIKRERQGLRFVKSPKTNRMLPSVTSVIGWDADFFVSAVELVQYASQGTIVHIRVQHYINTGKWIDAKLLNDTWADIVILTKGSLRLPVDVGDFPKFLEKHPIKEKVNAVRLFNDTDKYTGEPDFYGIPDFKGALPIYTVFDVKRTPDKIKDGMQLAAYCKIIGAKQGIIVPISGKNQQGYSKPVVYNEKQLEGYYKMFLRKRNDFNKRYGI